MSRIVTIIGVVAAAMAIIFHLANIAPDAEMLILAVAVLLIGIGQLTGA